VFSASQSFNLSQRGWSWWTLAPA